MELSAGTARVTSAALRLRYLVLGAWMALWGCVLYRPHPTDTDWWVFEYGARMLSGLRTDLYTPVEGGSLHLYTWFPKLQIGPPPLLAAVPTQLATPPVGRVIACVAMCALGLVALLLVEGLARRTGVPRPRTEQLTLLGGLLVVPAWAVLAVYWMHLDDVLALVLVLLAARLLLDGRWLVPALLLGTAAAGKPWAVAFVPLLLLLPRPQRSPAVLVTLGAALLWWAPFILADPRTVTATGGIKVPAMADSTLRLLGVTTSAGDVRLAQLGLMVVAGVLVVRHGKWPALLMTVVALRMLVDPQTWSYYTTGLVLGAFLVDLLATRRRWPWLTTATLAFLGLQAALSVNAVTPVAGDTRAVAVLRIAVLVPLLVVFLLPARRVTFGRPAFEVTVAADPDHESSDGVPEVGPAQPSGSTGPAAEGAAEVFAEHSAL